MGRIRASRFVSLVAVFAALTAVCDSIMGISQFREYGVWWSWIFLIEPITGIVLGPYGGFLSTLIGVTVGHFIYFRGTPEFLFTLGAPVGAMISGLLAEERCKPVFAYYTVLFAAYFATPVTWQLPVWGPWNTYLAYGGLCALALLSAKGKRVKLKGKRSPYYLGLYAFIGLEADILFRIFLLVPCQTYRFIYGWPVEGLQLAWALGAVVTPIQVTLSALITTPLVGLALIKALGKMGFRAEEPPLKPKA